MSNSINKKNIFKEESGFTIVEVIICFLLGGVVSLCIISSVHKATQKNKADLKVRYVEVPTNIISKPAESIIICVDGFKTIFIDGENYNIGKKDSWGDIKAIECKNKGEL